MEGIVFVPGIFGSQLYFNENGASEIWPPGPEDALFGYQEIDELIDPARVTVGNVVDYIVVPAFPVYSTIENSLRDICNRINGVDNGPYLPVPYDWRVDLFAAARDLEAQVTQWAADPRIDSITFFAHSMGGMVVRLMLESVLHSTPEPQRPAWVAKARRAVFACTPHLGAPKALALVLGVAGDETLSPDQCKQLSGNAAFPSAYQLVPPPARNLLFDVLANAWIPYDSNAAVTQLGLSGANIAASKRVRSELAIANRTPGNIEYFFMYGTGLATDESIDLQGLTTAGATIVAPEDGDGTVPTWSITEAANQASPVIPTWGGPGEHLALLSTDGFRQELYRYFGLGSSAPAVAAASPAAGRLMPAAETTAPGATAANLSVQCNKRQYLAGATMHVLLIPDQPTETLSGTLRIRRLVTVKGAGGALTQTLAEAPVASKTVAIQGGPVKTHSLRIAAPSTPGAYQLEFGGLDATHNSAPAASSWFFVRANGDYPTRGLRRRQA